MLPERLEETDNLARQIRTLKGESTSSGPTAESAGEASVSSKVDTVGPSPACAEGGEGKGKGKARAVVDAMDVIGQGSAARQEKKSPLTGLLTPPCAIDKKAQGAASAAASGGGGGGGGAGGASADDHPDEGLRDAYSATADAMLNCWNAVGERLLAARKPVWQVNADATGGSSTGASVAVPAGAGAGAGAGQEDGRVRGGKGRGGGRAGVAGWARKVGPEFCFFVQVSCVIEALRFFLCT